MSSLNSRSFYLNLDKISLNDPVLDFLTFTDKSNHHLIYLNLYKKYNIFDPFLTFSLESFKSVQSTQKRRAFYMKSKDQGSLV